MKPKLKGGCLCGGTRYELNAEVTNVGDCHCIDCRKASGAPYVTWGVVERHAIQIIRGDLRLVTHANRVRCFASCCGTPMFFEDAPASATVDVTIATLDQPERFRPDKVIWLEDRLPWVALDPLLPHFQRSSKDG